MAVWEKFDPKESNALEDDPAEDGPAAPFGDPYSKLLSYRDFPSDPGRARACDPRLRRSGELARLPRRRGSWFAQVRSGVV
jgi:hypothetical protein